MKERYVDPKAKHGTTNAYFNRGCRCDLCTKAGVSYSKENYRKRIARERELAISPTQPAHDHNKDFNGS